MIQVIKLLFLMLSLTCRKLMRIALGALCVSPSAPSLIASSITRTDFSIQRDHFTQKILLVYYYRMVPRKIPYIPKRGVPLGDSSARLPAVAPSQDGF
jgi:hypothetical protein